MYHSNLYQDQVVLVTGGRSGIGYDIAANFLRLGAKVFICSRKAEPLMEAKEELAKIGPCAAKACDIRKPEELEALADAIEQEYGRLDILINNAGGQFPSLAEYISDNGWAAVINNNLNGTFYASRIMANRFFIPQQKGSIVNIIVSMLRGVPGMAHTGAARAGVENLSKSLAQEWARFNVRINNVAPGIIISSGSDTYAEPVKALLDEMQNQNLMGRHGSMQEVSNAVLFLAGPLASYTSGTTLYVDGMDHLHGDRMTMIKPFMS